ncbi:hypothetical protein [Asticcacaulis benevestitus]|nr:hypothetical protein [Asticcacaulis benevestitus]
MTWLNPVVLVSAALVSIGLPAPVLAVTGPTMSANQFNQMLMVDTHLGYTDGTYGLIKDATGRYVRADAYVKAAADYVGIHIFRDGLTDGTAGSSPLSYYQTVAKSGISFVLVASGNTEAALSKSLSQIDTLNSTPGAVGSVLAIEGANEINNAPVCWGPPPCIGGLAGGVARQLTLQKLVRASTRTPKVPRVVYFTGWDAVPGSPGPDPASGYADYNNQHPYPNFGQPPYFWLSRDVALKNSTNKTARAMFTEVGYASGPLYGSKCNGGKGGVCWNNNGTWGTKPQVSEEVQAKFTLLIPFDAALLRVDRIAFYELLTGYKDKGVSDSGFGMFRYSANGTLLPKPVATALRNLTTVTADAGKVTTVTPLRYEVTGLPTHGYCPNVSVSKCTFNPTLAMQKSNGQYLIAVWAEQGIWNPDTHVATQGVTYAATVTLPQQYSKLEVIDPYVSATPIATYTYAASLKVSVVDRPILIRVTP